MKKYIPAFVFLISLAAGIIGYALIRNDLISPKQTEEPAIAKTQQSPAMPGAIKIVSPADSTSEEVEFLEYIKQACAEKSAEKLIERTKIRHDNARDFLTGHTRSFYKEMFLRGIVQIELKRLSETEKATGSLFVHNDVVFDLPVRWQLIVFHTDKFFRTTKILCGFDEKSGKIIVLTPYGKGHIG